jgi:2,5-diamino-6-(ribosylamino)-4(3H)-pyrimidinone 5'-phosphate reductase
MPRPYVTLNVAATVDGKIDTVDRRGAAISTERDRQRVDQLRAASDAVMVGGRTLLDEDPRLTVRSPELRAARLERGQPENPAKVSLVSRPGLKDDSGFLTSGPARIILLTPATLEAAERASLTAHGVEVITAGETRVDLVQALDLLAGCGIQRLLVEGGGTLNFELLQRGLVDEVQVFVAPLIFGGARAPTLADGSGFTRDLALQLRRTDFEIWEDGGVLLRYMVVRR